MQVATAISGLSDNQAGKRLPSEHSLAEKFGVSRETVRKALRHLRSQGRTVTAPGKGTFTSAVRKRVYDIAFVVPYPAELDDDHYYRELHRGITMRGDMHCVTISAEHAPRFLRDHTLDGAIICADPVLLSSVMRAVRRRLPAVLIGCTKNTREMPSVQFDNREAVISIIHAALARGARRFTFIGNLQASGDAAERLAAATSALTEQGLTLAEGDTVFIENDSACLARWCNDNCTKESHPDIIIMLTEGIVRSVIAYLSARSIHAPDEIMLAGFDDPSWYSLVHPSMTAIRQPLASASSAAADMLISIIETGREKDRHRILTNEAIFRESLPDIGH